MCINALPSKNIFSFVELSASMEAVCAGKGRVQTLFGVIVTSEGLCIELSDSAASDEYIRKLLGTISHVK